MRYLAFSIFSFFEIILIIFLAAIFWSVCEEHEVNITLVDSFISAGIFSLVLDRCWDKAEAKASEKTLK